MSCFNSPKTIKVNGSHRKIKQGLHRVHQYEKKKCVNQVYNRFNQFLSHIQIGTKFKKKNTVVATAYRHAKNHLKQCHSPAPPKKQCE